MPAFCRLSSRFLTSLLLCAAMATGAGCGEGGNAERTDKTASERGTGELRIVSLSPAISRTLMDFGLADRIIGRSMFCDCLDPDTPVVGDLHAVNYERLLELKPTHVLRQASTGDADRKLREFGEEHGWVVSRWERLDTVDDIEDVVRDLPWILYEQSPEDRFGMARRAAELINEIAGALSPGSGDLWRGETLIVHTLRPVGVFGHGTYLHDVLTRLGGINAMTAEGWVELSLEDIARLNPQAIIMVRPGAAADPDPLEAAGALGRLDIDAAREGRIALLTHEDALRPCTGIIGVAAEMRNILRQFEESGEPPP
ncbi:MAG: hypothetical protein JSV91_15135 [Phycisphaerales bacterium]|nr:MAG: hypothetical protein JSV91_15135 [Phycisphaerales bacterium]